MINENRLYFVLGLKRKFETDGERLLKLLLERYGIWTAVYQVLYCYYEEPPTKAKERAGIRDEARRYIKGVWTDRPGVIVGFGWMACEILTGRGKTKLKDMTGTKWKSAIEEVDQAVWMTYDPAACLFDPGTVVDIAAVIVAAGKEVGLPMAITEDETLHTMTNMHRIWKRYL